MHFKLFTNLIITYIYYKQYLISIILTIIKILQKIYDNKNLYSQPTRRSTGVSRFTTIRPKTIRYRLRVRARVLVTTHALDIGPPLNASIKNRSHFRFPGIQRGNLSVISITEKSFVYRWFCMGLYEAACAITLHNNNKYGTT